jgi:hypothetical protein
MSEGLGRFNLVVDAGATLVDRWKDSARGAADEAKRWREEVERISKLEPRLRNMPRAMKDADIAGTVAGIELQAQPDTPSWFLPKESLERLGESELDRQLRLHNERMGLLEEEERRHEEARQRMADGFADMVNEISKSAFEGSQDINDLMRRVWMNMFRLMSQEAIGTSFSPPGFATGGSFTVGGSGGTDTTPVAFMATPGERVTVETPGQQAEDDSGGTRVINIHLGERDVLRALDTPEGEKLIVKVMRKANRAVKGHTTGN